MNQRWLDVLNILYQVGEPMTAVDIVNNSKDLTQSTVSAVLRSLLTVGYVEVAGVTHAGKVLSRTYKPTPADKTAILDHFARSYISFRNVVSLDELVEYIGRLETD